MVTDDERRRVAATLRDVDAERLVRDYGNDVICSVLMLGYMAEVVGVHHAPYQVDFAELRDRLADIIDPGPECDREALLALARWLDARAADLLKTNSIDHSRRRVSARKEHAMDLMTACGRIREACGEAANGLPALGASRAHAPGGRAQVGGAGRAAGAGARHEKN